MQAKEPSGSESLQPKATKLIISRKGPLVAGAVALFSLTLLIFTPGDLLSKLFIISSGVCPQRPAHSSFFQGQQLPLEARMVGIFGGFALMQFFLWFIGRSRTLRLPTRPLTLVLMGLVLLTALDGLNATFYDVGLLYLYEPQLALRVITGTLAGLALTALIQPFFNLLVWKLAQRGGTLQRWRELGAGLLLGGGLIAATLSGWVIFFWPLALLAVGGVFSVMVMLNTMIYLMLVGSPRQNFAKSAADLLTPVSLIFLFTLAEMGLLAIVRVNLIGSPL